MKSYHNIEKTKALHVPLMIQAVMLCLHSVVKLQDNRLPLCKYCSL